MCALLYTSSEFSCQVRSARSRAVGNVLMCAQKLNSCTSPTHCAGFEQLLQMCACSLRVWLAGVRSQFLCTQSNLCALGWLPCTGYFICTLPVHMDTRSMGQLHMAEPFCMCITSAQNCSRVRCHSNGLFPWGYIVPMAIPHVFMRLWLSIRVLVSYLYIHYVCKLTKACIACLVKVESGSRDIRRQNDRN